MEFPFVGPSYVYRSQNYDVQRSVNLYPVKSEVGDSKSISALEGTPGRVAFITFPVSPLRGVINCNGRVFWVASNTLYEIFVDGTYVSRGTINSNTGTVGIDWNGFQICIVDGPNGYIFTLATNVLAEITDPYFLGSNTVSFITGYFMFTKPDSQIYYISALYDGTTGDPLDFASAEGSPDNLVGVVAVHQQAWLLGQKTVQIVTNTGDANFPFQTVQGTLIEYGCAAPYSIVVSANIIFWVGQDAEGNGVIWKAEGYSPVRISTHAVEFAIQQYGTISDCVGFAYQEDGHYFVQFNFPHGLSWVYDVELNLWHERAYWSSGEYSRDRANFHVFAYNKHLVGDFDTGVIYQQSLSIYNDNGTPIRRLRTAPYISDDLNYIYFNSFQLDMQTGIGVTAPPTGGAFDSGFSDGFDIGNDNDTDTNPKLVLSWTNDGHTWSNNKMASAGKIGQYGVRAIWRRLGRGRQRAFKVVFSANCKVFWIASHLSVEKGSN